MHPHQNHNHPQSNRGLDCGPDETLCSDGRFMSGEIAPPEHPDSDQQQRHRGESGSRPTSYGPIAVRTHEGIHAHTSQYGDAECQGQDGTLPQHRTDHWEAVEDRDQGWGECDRNHDNAEDAESHDLGATTAHGDGHHCQHNRYHADIGGRFGVPADVAEPMAVAERQSVEPLEDDVHQVVQRKGGIPFENLRGIPPGTARCDPETT